MDRVWHTESVNNDVQMSFALTDGGCNVEWFTEKARMELVDTRAYGKMLLIDGELQSTERDEYIYHEMLVHTICFWHGAPKRVKVYGGGEGAVARELLKWECIERIVQVDWDAQLLEHFKSVWTQWSQGAFSDPRLELRVEDAWVDCKTDMEKYDVIIVDLPDPEDLDAFRTLIEGVKRQLAPGGAFIMNAGPIQPWDGGFAEKFAPVLKEIFPTYVLDVSINPPTDDHLLEAYHVNVPSFAAAGEWCFLAAINTGSMKDYTQPKLPEGLRRFSHSSYMASRSWPDDWPKVFSRFN